ncbi:hypothetical protein [Pseudogemmobacter sonorensis]|uniref:hypothetical protein n=1 Tax=Pseudogemmobacter sonorensis TaxID=2989681 RepID=UPI0036C0EAB5
MTHEHFPQHPPLGFFDLDEGEALVVALYRDWKGLDPIPEIAERQLALLLRHDSLHGLLEALFAVFRRFGPEPCFLGEGAGWGLLDAAEIALVESLARPEAAGEEIAPLARQCRSGLERAGLSLRPPATIPRSGRDHLESAIARSYLVFRGFNAG